MKRPCTCDKTDVCRLCWLYHNDDRYKKLWTPPELGANFTAEEVKVFMTVGPGLDDSTKADAPPVWNYKEVVEPPTIQPILAPTVTSTKAVVTVAVGEKGQQWLQLSRPSMEAYANRINADFHVLSDKTTPYPMGEKWRVGQYLDFYERLLFIDADVVVRPTAPDLFDMVPTNAVGLHDDLPYNTAGYAWYFTEVEHVQRTQGFKLRPLTWCLNTGLVVCSREHKAIWEPPTKPFQALHCFEQHLINVRIAEAGFPVVMLPTKVHWQYWLDRQKTIYPEGQFLHFAGEMDHQKRVRMMTQAAEDVKPKPVPAPPPKIIKKRGCGCRKKLKPR
jgi:hypothetical protein